MKFILALVASLGIVSAYAADAAKPASAPVTVVAPAKAASAPAKKAAPAAKAPVKSAPVAAPKAAASATK